MHEILVIGHVCIDENRMEHDSYRGPGGPAMFMAKIFRQIPDCHLTIIAPYGADFIPYTREISFYPPKPNVSNTMRYTNTIVEGKRTQTCANWEDAKPIPMDKTFIQSIKAADTICFAPLAPTIEQDYVREILTFRKSDSTTVLLPQGYFRAFSSDGTVRVGEFTEASGVLPLIDIVIVSDEDHPDMLNLGQVWSIRYKNNVVVTQSERGAADILNGIIKEVPTTPVPSNQIISSVGAGDAFAAGFIYQFHLSHDIEKSVIEGNVIARQCLLRRPDDIRVDVY